MRLKKFGEKLTSITPNTIFEKVYNVHPVIKYGVIIVVMLFVGAILVFNGLKYDPVAIEREFSQVVSSDYYNFTMNKQYKVGSDTYSIITYTTDDGWYAGQWNNMTNTEFNRQPIQNDITLSHPIAIGQVVSYFEEEIGPIETFETLDNDTLLVNDKEVSGVVYNTQLTEITIDGETYDVDKFYNVLIQQRGQLDLLDRYNINADEIAINYVENAGTVEFIYASKAWELSTQHNESETVRLKWMNYNPGGGL